MTDNPFTANKDKSKLDLSVLDKVNLPGAPSNASTIKQHIKKVYDHPLTTRLDKATYEAINAINKHADPDIKRSYGVILEQAIKLYIKEKGIIL